MDASGRASGVLTEEDVRLGLAGRSRPQHAASSLARPIAEFPAFVAADGAILPDVRPAPKLVGRALLMAGGEGRRLRPLTTTLPKPLLQIEGEPLLHRIVRQVVAAGIEQCWIAVRYLQDKIRRSLGDGSAFGTHIEYIEEDEPLGTAGALGLLPRDGERTLVMNGDVLTDISLPALFAWHVRHGNHVTVATQLFEVDVPFGLAHFDGQRLEHLEEKPTLRLPVNAGVYVFEGSLVAQVDAGSPRDMVEWLNQLGKLGHAGQFPLVERWHDIGSLAEYQKLTARH